MREVKSLFYYDLFCYYKNQFIIPYLNNFSNFREIEFCYDEISNDHQSDFIENFNIEYSDPFIMH